MKNLNLLVVEGNLQKENETFKKSGIPTHAESLKAVSYTHLTLPKILLV